jgi:mannose-6-phosphate isomerase-like protein (cupin superfamily)
VTSGRLRFTEAKLEPVEAHQGHGHVLYRRVVERLDGSAINFIDFTIVPVGASIGVHRHGPHDEEIYVILEGSGLMTVDGAQVAVSAGDLVVNRPCGTHGLTNTGTIAIKMAVIDVARGGRPYTEPVDIGD